MARTVSARRAATITAFACAAPIVSHSIGRSVYGLLLPAIKDDLSLSNAQAGWPSSGIFVVYIVGVLAVVFLSPRVEPITIMRTALVMSTAGLLITATSSGLATLTIGVSLLGGAGAGIWMTAPVLATEYVSERRRGVVIGAMTSTIGLANIAFGVGTSGLRRVTDDEQLWRPVWWLALAVTATLALAMMAIARFPKTARIRTTTTLDFSIIRRIPRWREVTLAYALFGGMAAGFGTFIVAALEDHGDIAESTSPLVFSAMGIAGMLAAPLAGALSDRVGRIKVLRGTLVLLALANVLVAIGGKMPVVIGALLYSAGASSVPALVATYVRDSLDNRSFSQALAMMTILFSVMAAILPAVVGLIADTSFRWSYLVLASLPAGAFVLLSARPPNQQSAGP